MIRFDSDYLEGCHPAILKRLQDTDYEQTPGYGEDHYCQEAASLIKKVCDAPGAAVHFLVGGTQTNATFISSVLRPHQGVLCASSAHIGVHETGAIEHSGHKVLSLPATDGKITAAQVREAVERHRSDPTHEHTVQPGMVYISFPTEYGTIYSAEELAQLSKACHDCDIPLYVDGARLGYGLSCDANDLDIKDFARYCDAFYIGGTKQGALFGEALVIVNPALQKDFRYFIKQNGGMLAKGRLLGLQFLGLFEEDLYLGLSRSAVTKAQRIAEALRGAGYSFHVESPTNQIFPVLTDNQISALSQDFGFEIWEPLGEGRSAVRFVTSWATTDAQADALINAFSRL